MFTSLPPINWRISQPPKVSFSPPWQMSSLQHRQHRSQNWAHVLVAHVPILKGKAILATLSRIVDVCRCEFKKRLTPQFMVLEKIMDHWDHWMERGIWYLGVPPRKPWCVTPFSPRIQDTKRCTKAEDKDPHLGAAGAAGSGRSAESPLPLGSSGFNSRIQAVHIHPSAQEEQQCSNGFIMIYHPKDCLWAAVADDQWNPPSDHLRRDWFPQYWRNNKACTHM